MAALHADLDDLIARRGDIAPAKRHADAAVRLREQIGAPKGLAHALLAASAVPFWSGDYSSARDLAEQALGTFAEVGAAVDVAMSEQVIAACLRREGDSAGARAHLERALEAAGDTGDVWEVLAALVELAGLEVEDCEPVRAAVILGAADRLRFVSGCGVEDERDVERTRRETRAQLGDQRFERHWALGESMSLDEIRSCAVERRAQVHRAFMFTDVVGSTRLVEAIGDGAWADLPRWHDRALRALFERNRGEEVDHAGDGFFAAFEDAEAAIDCAVAIRRELDEHRRVHGFAPGVRIGIHAADALADREACRGRGVHTAGRIAGLAGAGEIVATVATVAARHRGSASPPRSVALKGLPDAIEVVTVDWH